MSNIIKNTQVNFRTNDMLLQKARAVFSERQMDVSASLNLFLEKVVETGDFPFATTADEENERVFQALKDEVAKGYASYRAGEKISAAEMRIRFGL